MLRHLQRETDALVRYGGEEFLCLLSNTDALGARIVAERIQQAVANLELAHPSSPEGVVTVSIGGATWYGAVSKMTPDKLFQFADAELYRAKRLGRNRVSLADTLAHLTSEAAQPN